MSQSNSGEAFYITDIQVRYIGHAPSYSNRAAPEMARVAEAAKMAARRVIEDAGYTIQGTGFGSRRTDLDGDSRS